MKKNASIVLFVLLFGHSSFALNGFAEALEGTTDAIGKLLDMGITLQAQGEKFLALGGNFTATGTIAIQLGLRFEEIGHDYYELGLEYKETIDAVVWKIIEAIDLANKTVQDYDEKSDRVLNIADSLVVLGYISVALVGIPVATWCFMDVCKKIKNGVSKSYNYCKGHFCKEHDESSLEEAVHEL